MSYFKIAYKALDLDWMIKCPCGLRKVSPFTRGWWAQGEKICKPDRGCYPFSRYGFDGSNTSRYRLLQSLYARAQNFANALSDELCLYA